jgi:hypothetical protein
MHTMIGCVARPTRWAARLSRIPIGAALWHRDVCRSVFDVTPCAASAAAAGKVRPGSPKRANASGGWRLRLNVLPAQ